MVASSYYNWLQVASFDKFNRLGNRFQFISINRPIYISTKFSFVTTFIWRTGQTRLIYTLGYKHFDTDNLTHDYQDSSLSIISVWPFRDLKEVGWPLRWPLACGRCQRNMWFCGCVPSEPLAYFRTWWIKRVQDRRWRPPITPERGSNTIRCWTCLLFHHWSIDSLRTRIDWIVYEYN